MDKTLKNATVYEQLLKQDSIDAEGTIRCQENDLEMNLIGFLPYNRTWSFFYFDLNGKMSVATYWVKFKDTPFFLKVANHAKLSKEKKICLHENTILPIKDLANYVKNQNNGSFKKRKDDFNKRYEDYMISQNKTTAEALIKAVENEMPVDFLSIDDDFHIYYKPDNNPIIFWDDNSLKEIVADSFLCLCSYINPVTGLISYTALSPERCIYTISKDGDKIKRKPPVLPTIPIITGIQN